MSATFRFLLNGAAVEIAGVAPQTTLLAWLRECRQLTGTKEGCAEGDCGACTVVIAEGHDARLAWKPINACIRLLPSLAGTAVFTVESLKEPAGTPHPVQQAMVESHGSQCGFCTPGFVMASHALLTRNPNPTEEEIRHDLSSNLCMCTGYVQIVEAVKQAAARLQQWNTKHT